jgi:D-glycero-D-manno-heptose 1,7-bisphosphate phosphatase
MRKRLQKPVAGHPPSRNSRLSRIAVFLDRDGVINRSEVRDGKPYAPRRLQDFRLLPGVVRAIHELKQAGLLIIVVTNQPDIGNGMVDAAVVHAMHDRLRQVSLIDDIMVCPHRQNAGCQCRKPSPGMLIEAAKKWEIDLKNSFMVGDRWGDIVAGERAGCYNIYINRHYKEEKPQQTNPDNRAASLPGAVRLILGLTKIH